MPEPVPVPDDPGVEPLGALVESEMQSGREMPGGHGCRVPDMPVLRSFDPDWPVLVPGDVVRPDGLPVGFEPLPSRVVDPPGELPVDDPPVVPGDDPGDDPGDEPLPVCALAVLTRSNDVAAIAMLAFQSMLEISFRETYARDKSTACAITARRSHRAQ